MIDSELADIPLAAWPTEADKDNEYVAPCLITKTTEQFGTLRFQYQTLSYSGGKSTGISEAQANRIAAAVRMTEELSSTVCEVCGDIGCLCVKDGWTNTLCPECAEIMGYEPCRGLPMDEEGDSTPLSLNTSHEEQH
jgi:hypothetical protein